MISRYLNQINHDDIKWKHFPRYWPFVRGIHHSSVNSPHKGQWSGALMFSLICAWIRLVIWDAIRHRAHYAVIVMMMHICITLLERVRTTTSTIGLDNPCLVITVTSWWARYGNYKIVPYVCLNVYTLNMIEYIDQNWFLSIKHFHSIHIKNIILWIKNCSVYLKNRDLC